MPECGFMVKFQTSFVRLVDSRVEVDSAPWPKFLGPLSVSLLGLVYGQSSF